MIDYIDAHRGEFGVEPIRRVLAAAGVPIVNPGPAFGTVLDDSVAGAIDGVGGRRDRQSVRAVDPAVAQGGVTRVTGSRRRRPSSVPTR
ncbi:hypothetical protein MMF94_42540 [Pseudonocardia alaniniphila]|uniref:Uncharacterized protein n=1 Tax=Pseudonocardia alaniniphila TaxID=75291 RepID=A0ABS9TV02_9PSEU|nr:hypothetical protein [Pseudonocardia alaniniphila]MCH6172390.1 hypothetical protein [Pseudonocardia alaniniphila]